MNVFDQFDGPNVFDQFDAEAADTSREGIGDLRLREGEEAGRQKAELDRRKAEAEARHAAAKTTAEFEGQGGPVTSVGDEFGKPLLSLDRIKPGGDSIGAGIGRGALNTVEMLTTPENVLVGAATFGLGGVAGRALGFGLGAQMATQAPEMVSQIAQAETPGDAAERATEATLALGMMGATAGYAGSRMPASRAQRMAEMDRIRATPRTSEPRPTPPPSPEPTAAQTPPEPESVPVESASPNPFDGFVETQSELGGVPVRRVSTETIATRPDLMQFKRMDEAASGVNEAERLAGTWDDLKAGNLLLWEPLDPAAHGLAPGEQFIVANGHHRVEFGKREGVQNFNAQIVREADGFSAQDARRLGAEINIADNKGTIYDQAKFLRNLAATHGADEALAAGRRIGARGRKAAGIAFSSTDPVFEAFINERIGPDAAEAVASAAPGNEAAQMAGLRAALEGKPADYAANRARAELVRPENTPKQTDLFGNEIFVEIDAQAEVATAAMRAIREQITAVQSAARRPEQAAKLGVKVTDPAAVLEQVLALKAELARWENWPMHPDLVAQTRAGSAAKVAQDFALETQTEESIRAEKLAEEQRAKIKAGSEAPLTGSAGDLTADLFGPTEGPTPLFNTRQALGDPGAPVGAGKPPPDTRLLAMSPTGTATGGPVSIPQVMQGFEGIVASMGGHTPLRVGRFLQRALGIYKPGPRVARVGNAGNLATAAHEIAHALQHESFGDVNSGVLHAKLPAPAVKELVVLGQKLYPKAPHNGWASEGWAEFWRHYLTRDDAATVAPELFRYVTRDFLPVRPALREAVSNAKRLSDTWRSQGAMARAEAQMPRPPGAVARMAEKVRGIFSVENWIEEFRPLRQLAEEAERITGHRLSPASNPYEVASARRGASGAVTLQMVQHGMVDLSGNLARDSSGRIIGSLREAVAPLRGLEDEFAYYLWARRAIELHGRGRDPGMALDDARHLVAALEAEHPLMAPAAERVYAWQDGVLDYLVQAVPEMQGAVDAMRAVSDNYVPLQRVMGEKGAIARAKAAASGGGSLSRLRGSGRQVKPILDQIVQNTQQLVAMAHRGQVLKSMARLSEIDGMGWLLEEVPRDRVRNRVDIDKIRDQLEDMGVDTSAVPAGEMFDFYTLAQQPRGADPILPVRRGAELRWYQVAPELYDVLAGMEPTRLTGLTDLLLGAPARAFRMGTTGLRAGFALVTNPLRDFQTLLSQTMGSHNPARVLAEYVGALRDEIVVGMGGKPSRTMEAFRALGVEGGQPLGIDVPHTRKAVRSLFEGRARQVVRHPIEFLRATLNFMESVPRVAEMEMVAKKIGWTPGTPLSPDQAIALANAGRRVTTDFAAGGSIAKAYNQAIPFFNAAIQGSRIFARQWRERPATAAVRALAYAVVPALYLWNRNKDEDWWQELPWREKFLYWNFSPDGRNLIQIPRSIEWGAIGALAEAAADSWHRQDPESATAVLGHLGTVLNPADLPVLLKAGKEQWANRIEFFDRPIVPRSQIDLPPGEQVGEYTSEISQALGRAFPNTLSPRRMDAAVRAVFGGVGGDLLSTSDRLLHALGVTAAPERTTRSTEASDFPIYGRLLRRGGVSTANSQALADFWDAYLALEARSRSKVNPLDPRLRLYKMRMDTAKDKIKLLDTIADKTPSMSARQSLHRSMTDLARRTLETAPRE